MGGVKDNSVGSGVDQKTDPVERVGLDSGGGGDEEAALAVLGGDRVVLDLHKILVGDQADELAVIINNRKLLDLAVLEDLRGVGQGDALRRGHEVLLCHNLGNRQLHILLEPQVTVSDDSDEEAVGVHDRNAADVMLLHHREGVADIRVRADRHRIVDHSVLSPLHVTHLLALLLDGHILVNHTDTTGPRHRYGKIGFCDCVHRGRHDRGVELDVSREICCDIHVTRKYIGMCRNQQNVIEGEAFRNLSVYKLRHCNQINLTNIRIFTQ